MNYIKEINAFYDWLLYNSLPTGAIVLWHALMSINNKAGWADEFTVANIVLQGMTGLSRQGLDRARNTLIQKGLISYKKGTSNQAGKYKMISFECQKVGTAVGTKQDTEEDIEKVECKIVGTEQDTKRTKSDTQSGHNGSTLYKLNETKLNDINTSATTELEENIDEEFKELAQLYQKCGFDVDGFTPEWLLDSKDRYGFEWVKNAMLEAEKQGARRKAYVEKILRNWSSWGGMKLSTDVKDTSPKTIVQAKKNRFHNFEQRSDKYTAEQLEEIGRKKMEKYLKKMKIAQEDGKVQ